MKQHKTLCFDNKPIHWKESIILREKKWLHGTRLDVQTAMFCVMTPCNIVDIYWYLEEPAETVFRIDDVKKKLPCKHQRMFTRLDGATRAEIAHSLMLLATGWTVLGSNFRGLEIFCAHPVRLQDPATLVYNENWDAFPRSKAARAWRSSPISN